MNYEQAITNQLQANERKVKNAIAKVKRYYKNGVITEATMLDTIKQLKELTQ